MGGSAVLIYGNLEQGRFEVKKGIAGRLLSCLGGGPKVIDLGSGRRLINLPAGNLNGLSSEFTQYLRTKIPKAWTATSLLLNSFLDGGVMSVYVRGERSQDAADEWYVQLTFSGCAGLAEVSAEIACHWAEIWYEECREKISEKYFSSYGFQPHPEQEKVFAAHKFLPLGNLGYAMFVDKFKWSPPLEHSFEIDGALEELEEFGVGSGIVEMLEVNFSPLMTDNTCKCQLCRPEFDAESIERRVSENLPTVDV